MSKKQTIEDMVVVLVTTFSGEIQATVREVEDMAMRAFLARTCDDPTWWEVVGRPEFNQRMAQIRRRLEPK